MPSHVLLSLCATATLGIAAVVCAGISLARVQELSLPFPASMPALNILLPFLAATAVPLSRRLTQQVKGPLLRLLSSYLASTSMLAPFTLFVLSLVYALPSTLRSCAADQQWQRMFQNKDVSGIRTIQARLQCCGFNSMHDRAWPFPSRDTDARTCERTLGYIMACGIVWRQEETFAAVLSAIASLLNWLLLALVVAIPWPSEDRIRVPAWSTRPTRFIAGRGALDGEESNGSLSAEDAVQHQILNHDEELT